MADQKISALTLETSLASTDLMYLLKDPSGTPLDRKVQIYTFSRLLTANYITAASVTADTGTITSGSVTTTRTKDGTSLTVQETTGSDPLRVRFTFATTDAPIGLVLRAYYSGSSSHTVVLQIYNAAGSAWETLVNLAEATELRWYNMPLYYSGDYRNGSGDVEIRIYHVSSGVNTHYLYVDYIALIGW